MEKARLIAALQAEGVIVDKRWGVEKLRQEAVANGIDLPEQDAGPAEDIPEFLSEPEAEPAPKAAPKKEGTQCVVIVNGLHIEPKHIVGRVDAAASEEFNMKDRVALKDEGLARALEKRGQVVVIE